MQTMPGRHCKNYAFLPLAVVERTCSERLEGAHF
jgi:hypothetical protein